MKSMVGKVIRIIGWISIILGIVAWLVLLSMSNDYHYDISSGIAFTVLGASAVVGAFFIALGEIICLLRDCLSRLNQVLGLPDEVVKEEPDEGKVAEPEKREETSLEK